MMLSQDPAELDRMLELISVAELELEVDDPTFPNEPERPAAEAVLDEVYRRLLGRPYRTGELVMIEAELARQAASWPEDRMRRRAEGVVRSLIEFQQRVYAILDRASRNVRGRPFVPGERPELIAKVAAALGRLSIASVCEFAREALRDRGNQPR